MKVSRRVHELTQARVDAMIARDADHLRLTMSGTAVREHAERANGVRRIGGFPVWTRDGFVGAMIVNVPPYMGPGGNAR